MERTELPAGPAWDKLTSPIIAPSPLERPKPRCKLEPVALASAPIHGCSRSKQARRLPSPARWPSGNTTGAPPLMINASPRHFLWHQINAFTYVSSLFRISGYTKQYTLTQTGQHLTDASRLTPCLQELRVQLKMPEPLTLNPRPISPTLIVPQDNPLLTPCRK